ncbi:MAG: hypothetical protein KC582_01795 [Candidatus Magasanikbacteria bacterium]|nr:hypothetical protein [Candidatus Magasanikbacteria bacterium]MCA9389192.1 hypothetical protein [Candidatus Magasanikbacteria bacterium]MCA9390964.1 hypothetical protein [Candidatus Magasanikbacteria bacterium]USN53048.1 MAG: hypothetical protein H6759_03735 [Candidatus Nomurabacteria bacterium]HPF95041.1 Ig-like domain-containing protein [bacterium]
MTIKTLLYKTIGPLGAIALFAMPVISHAETAVPTLYSGLTATNSLIKGSGPAVYYLSSNGKRYVFPNEKTYLTWYSDFSSVQTISDSELAAISIGGNVTYRPGTRLIKITTDPRVYAVDTNGVLRWIGSEDVAKILYGEQWAKNVDDLSDAFFVNYSIGLSITNAAEYSPVTVTAKATSIDTDKNITGPTEPTTPTTPTEPTTPPTSTPATNKGTLYLSKNAEKPLGVINILATANPATNFSKVDLFFNGILTKTCAYNPCSTDETLLLNAEGTVPVVAKFYWMDASTYQTTSTITVIPGVAGLTLSTTRPEVRPDSYREVVARIESSTIIARTIEITMDGAIIKACDNVQECRSSELESSAIGTVHQFKAVITEPSGQRHETEIKTIEVVENEAPIIYTSIGNLLPVTGEQTEISAQASDEDGIDKMEILVNGVAVRTCNAASCSAMLGPWSTTQSVSVQVRATDLQNKSGLSDISVINVR